MFCSVRIITVIRQSTENADFIDLHRRRPSAFTRRRKLPFATLVGAILRLVKKSLQIECNLLAEQLMSEPVSKQAFSQARSNISYTGFKALNTVCLKEAYLGETTGVWNGFRVFGIDGSTIRLPKSAELVEYFGILAKPTDRPENCPVVARVSEVVELTTGVIVSAEIAPLSIGERILAIEQIKEVSNLFRELDQPCPLYVFDRGYVSKEMMKTILDVQSHFLYRVPRGFNREIDSRVKAGLSDCLIDLEGLPTLRLIVRTLPSEEKCVILASVTDSQISGDEFYRLYWLRWRGCEEGYKRQKVGLELENFSGTSLEVVLQEFWATVVVLNILSVQCVEEEGAWNPEAPPEYRINRAVVYGSLRDSIFRSVIGEMSAEDVHEQFKRVAHRAKIKIKPGRSFSREGVGKPKRYHVYRRTC